MDEEPQEVAEQEPEAPAEEAAEGPGPEVSYEAEAVPESKPAETPPEAERPGGVRGLLRHHAAKILNLAQEAEGPGRMRGLLLLAGRLWETRRRLVLGAAAGLCAVVVAAGLLWPRAAHERPEVGRAVTSGISLEADARTRLLEPFIFAAPSTGEQTIFKVGLAVEFADREAACQFDSNLSAARRDIYHLLQRAVEQQSLAEQKAALQEGVRGLLDARLGQGRVLRVYFSEFLAV